MAQGRSYNPLLKSYPDSEKVNKVSIGAETLYTRLIAKSDDAGRYWGEPLMIMAKLFTHRMAATEVSESGVRGWLDELEAVGLIRTYKCAGRHYLELVKVYKSLKSDRPAHVEFPYPDSGTAMEPQRNQTGTAAVPQPNPTQPTPTQPNAQPVRAADRFGEFWAAWPKHHRKVGKAQCQRLWARRGLDDIAEQVIAAVKRALVSPDWRKEGGAFIPQPQSWLNKTPWETDPAEIAGDFSDNGYPPGFVPRDPTPEEIAREAQYER